MSELPELNFPPIRLRARRRRDQVEVWDDLRGIWLVLTPEEWVRRHLIACLVAHCGAPARRIVQEYAVALNGQPQRADVVVVDDAGAPLLLVVERDIAKALGQAAAGVLAGGRPVVSLDSIHVEQNDYIDMGRPLMDGLVVPVVVKTLIFG